MTLADLQGNVVCGYDIDHALYLFATVEDAGSARTWLRERLDEITYNASWGSRRPEFTLNIAFTYAGLLALEVSHERLRGLDAFTAGMEARASLLGDVGACAPERWQRGLRGAHVLITIGAWDLDRLRDVRNALAHRLADTASGLVVGHAQAAAKLPGQREHFGFSDGFSQPSIQRARTGPRDGEGTLTRWGHWRSLALGEFVLGYQDEGGLSAPAPAGALGEDATFMVVRKLEQDVAAFRRYTRDQGERFGRSADWIAARMVGRWPNGSPLIRYPERPGPPASDERSATNRFRYGADPRGVFCPLGAHVRRAHPRDGLGWQGRLTQRHRILRRGMSYGRPLAPDALEPDGHERGLVFVCFQGSIERQFEFIQRQWLRDGNAFGLGADPDPLATGDPARDGATRDHAGEQEVSAQMVIQGHPPLYLSGIPRFVTLRGGGYFLVPGRAGLEALASGRG